VCSKTPHQKLVELFMYRACQAVPEAPCIPDASVRSLRARLILEEALETIAALGCTLQVNGSRIDSHISKFEVVPDGPVDLVEVVDGCCDIRVVTTGTLSACGVADDEVQTLVDLSNLAKFGPGHTIREDGKLIKPLDWVAPDLRLALIRQGWTDGGTSQA